MDVTSTSRKTSSARAQREMRGVDRPADSASQDELLVWTHQRFGVAEDVVLQELVQHVEQVVLHQRLDHQLVQVMLEKTITGVTRTSNNPSLLAWLC